MERNRMRWEDTAAYVLTLAGIYLLLGVPGTTTSTCSSPGR